MEIMKDKELIDQYALITNCANSGDFTTWNKYASNTNDLIKFHEANFEGLKFINVIFKNKNGKGADFYKASFKNAYISYVDMSECNFMAADLSYVNASGSMFQDSLFVKANLMNSEFSICGFSNASFQEAKLCSVNFINSTFFESNFYGSDLSGAKFHGGEYNPLVNKELRFNLCGANFRNAKFTNDTYFHYANVSTKTDFRTITFESAGYSPGLKQSLQYCNRKHNWIDWYEKQGKSTSAFVKLFWYMSDYGRSPKQVLKTFFLFVIFYTLLYYSFPSLTSVKDGLSLIRSLYFSIVTMTTLGFGDIYANPDNWFSQILIVTQVLSGYILLGALITVLSNLFISDGPSQGLIDHPKKEPIKVRSRITNVT